MRIAPEDIVGQVLASRYAIDGRLGDGGMGTVYRARHIKMGRVFAVKILHRRLMANPKVVRRFEREAELAGRLGHPNVVGVVDVGQTDDGLHYLVMEHAPGKTLATLIAYQSPMEEARVFEIARQLCDGLQHAHDVGLIHRDFKPENVLVDRDAHGRETARIVDFGIAIVREECADDKPHERLTTAGLIVGTPHYMAPEQARGEQLDHRVDLFSLGLILYEMLTGRMPFEGSGVDIARANMFSATPPMGVRVPTVQVDPLLEALVRKLLEKDREARPASAATTRELLDMIEHHRSAAAMALGVALPASPTEAVVPQDKHALRVLPPQNLSPQDTAVIGSLPAEHRFTREEEVAAFAPVTASRVRSRRRWVLALAAITSMIAVLTLALHRGGTGPANDATVPGLALTDTAPSIDELPVTAHDVPTVAPPVTGDHGLPVVVPKPIARRPARMPAGAGSQPRIAPIVAPVTSEPPTATTLAALYGSVGRELKSLDAHQGEDATIDLWPRYRWIRINESIVTPDKRQRAADMLARLREDITARAK